MKIILCFLAFMMLGASALAVEPDEMLKDPALEARAREISRDLRCLVCQGEAIDDSNSGFAKDLRLLVRDRLKEGDTDREVLRFVQERYGDFILLNPPLEWKTMLLWLAPLLVFGGGLGVAGAFIRRHRH